MPPQPFSHPWVYSAKITADKITFRVEVTDFKPAAGDIEISGQATQVGGAFAPIYEITNMAAAEEGDQSDDDERGRSFANVEAPRNPGYPFRNGQDITTFVRASKAWVTVIGESTTSAPSSTEPGQVANEGTWDKHKADAHIRSLPMLAQGSSHPWVYSATIADGKITFRVEVTDFQPTAGDIEISGQATQVGGAFAPIYEITNMAAAEEGDQSDDDERGRSFVNVEATINPVYPFRTGQHVTTFVRVSKAWVTVIGESTTSAPRSTEPGQVANEGTWDKHKADAHISDRTGSY